MNIFSFLRGTIFGVSSCCLCFFYLITRQDIAHYYFFSPRMQSRVRTEECVSMEDESKDDVDTIISSWTAKSWETSASRASFPFAHFLPANHFHGPYVHNQPFFLFYNAGDDFLQNYILSDFMHLSRLLENMYAWSLFTPISQDDWGDLLSFSVLKHGRAPDVVLFREQLELMALFSRFRHSSNGSAFAHTQVWVYLDDSHWHGRSESEATAHRSARARNLAEADVILATYAYTLPTYYSGLEISRIVWLPHAASPEFVRPYNPRPRAAAFIAGTLSKWYPLRLRAAALANRRPDVVLYSHPGDFPAKEGGSFQEQGLYETEPALRNKAARVLAREFNAHLACIVDGLALWHTIAKVFEIPATGCLMLADDGLIGPLSWLGFLPGVHFLPFNSSSLETVIDATLDPGRRLAVDEIRRNGQALVHTRHLVFHRAASLHETALARVFSSMPFPDVGKSYDFDIQAKIVEMDS